MAIKGVNPSYFAGMPTVALDPNAGKENPQYAQMLSQAMQHRAQATDRRRESDEENAFKMRTLDQQARRDRMSNDISKRNTAVSEAGEARLKSGQEFTQGRLKSVDTEHLIDALKTARYTHDKVAEEYFLGELESRGVQTRNRAPAPAAPPADPPPAPPTAAPPAAPPIDRSPMPPRSPPPTASFPPVGEAEAAPPMRGAPAGVAPSATASFPPTNGAPPPGPAPAPRPPPPAAAAPARAAAPSPRIGWPAPPGPTDDSAFFQAPFDRSGLEAGLDNVTRGLAAHPPTEKELLDRAIADVVAREAAGQTPTARPLLPGKTLRRRAVESDQMLDPNDPLLNQRAQ